MHIARCLPPKHPSLHLAHSFFVPYRHWNWSFQSSGRIFCAVFVSTGPHLIPTTHSNYSFSNTSFFFRLCSVKWTLLLSHQFLGAGSKSPKQGWEQSLLALPSRSPFIPNPSSSFAPSAAFFLSHKPLCLPCLHTNPSLFFNSFFARKEHFSSLFFWCLALYFLWQVRRLTLSSPLILGCLNSLLCFLPAEFSGHNCFSLKSPKGASIPQLNPNNSHPNLHPDPNPNLNLFCKTKTKKDKTRQSQDKDKTKTRQRQDKDETKTREEKTT